MRIGPNTLVDDVMRAYPRSIRVFMANRMQCIGCPVGRIHTLADACREHEIDLAELIAALEDMASAAAEERRGPSARPG